jgi:type I restriction enzyme S subunit
MMTTNPQRGRKMGDCLSNVNVGNESQPCLGDVLKLRREVVHPRDEPKGAATFVGLEHIEPGTGRRLGSDAVEMSKLSGRKPRFHAGDIVYGYLRPYLNKVWLADFDGLCSVDQYVYQVDITKADTEFIAWFMRSPLYLQRAPIDLTPGQLPRLRTDEVAAVELPLPSLKDQRRLAARLNSQMTAVEQSRQGIETMRQGLDDLVAAWIREGIQHPETTVEAVGEVLEEVTQGIGSRWTEFPVLGATRSGAAPAKDKVGKTPGRYKPVRPGSVFYNPMRIMIGSIAMLDEGDAPGITSPDYVVVRPRTEAVHPLWVYEWLRSTQGARFIQTLARGGVRERMLFTRLKAGDIPVPPQAWQQRFAEISRHRRQAVKLLDEQLSALDKLPGAYLREAFGSL